MNKLLSLVLSFGVFAKCDWVIAAPKIHKVELVEEYHPPLKSGEADLFIPLPLQDAGYQKVLSESHDSNATWVKVESVKIDGAGDAVRILHAHWDKATAPSLKLKEVLEISDRDHGLEAKQVDPYFLEPTAHVQTDGIVAQTAQKITKGLQDPDKKAKAIYDWIVDNTFREPKTRGCGLGDVKTTLQAGNLSGKCADLNSLFVGLARASGIPAREVWGLRVAPSVRAKSLGREGDVSKSQHCRAEYYSALQKAWIPADPADIRKVILEENLSVTDAQIKELRPQFFGTWEGNWVALNFGRDFELSNKKKMNFLMYPQLITATGSPDGVDPAEVGYQLTSKVL